MAQDRSNLVIGHPRSGSPVPHLGRIEEAIGIDPDADDPTSQPGKRCVESAAAPAEIVSIHGTKQGEITAAVEAGPEQRGVVIEITRQGPAGAGPEARLELLFGAEGHHADHPCQSHSSVA